ncbi:hypothetical protein A3770_11p62860 [Chloropicon primus]|uniref:Uncharacterized protein n=1 Tax=Chloropicon primus TaxID=1764295 RepID=A0A5B8MSM6_9CHLO|nr:hypothetical protein A3770_11p62860 [Chloropicon primus]|eukprot:QDZ23768.1 hypothetical protein A3770_11p62860 [Chloropicon primus]
MAVKKKIEKKKAPAKKSQEAKAKAVGKVVEIERGTFEVRCGGKAIASFEAMPRPFKALREADLEQIAKGRDELGNPRMMMTPSPLCSAPLQEAIRCLALKKPSDAWPSSEARGLKSHGG